MNPVEMGAAQDPALHLGPALIECSGHVEACSIAKSCRCLARVQSIAVGADGPMQRLAVAMADILARRVLRPVPAIADALIDPSDLLDRSSIRVARRVFFELSPFPRVAQAVMNRAFLEALENEQYVHIIDIAGAAAQKDRWIQLMGYLHLLQDLRRRSQGLPPSQGQLHLRLTVVHDDGDLLASMQSFLCRAAEQLGMAFQFHSVVGQIEDLDVNDLHGCLDAKSGEARVVCCDLQLHRLLAVDDAGGYSYGAASLDQIAQLQQLASSSTPARGDSPYRSPITPLTFLSPPATTPHLQMTVLMARFLSAVRALSPKIVVLTEQEASHNGLSFQKRFAEALHYYAAHFDVLDAAAGAARRTPAANERARAELLVLGEEMKGVLLREGVYRRERHDGLRQWSARMGLAGFGSVPLSYDAIGQANAVVRECGLRRCQNIQCGGSLLLSWSARPLYSVSAWRPSRAEQWPEALQPDKSD